MKAKPKTFSLGASQRQYAVLKGAYQATTLLLKTPAGTWLARWADADHVLAVHPSASMLPGDGVTVEDRHVDAIVAALKMSGKTVALAEPVTDMPVGAEKE